MFENYFLEHFFLFFKTKNIKNIFENKKLFFIFYS